MAADSTLALVLVIVASLLALAPLAVWFVLGWRAIGRRYDADPETQAWRTIARGGSVHG